ncbi:MAG TPA: hypothetical protein VL134_12090 [Leptolyngbya sp.]|nr:hypothetical protein [Leptolyngbya sp.]
MPPLTVDRALLDQNPGVELRPALGQPVQQQQAPLDWLPEQIPIGDRNLLK